LNEDQRLRPKTFSILFDGSFMNDNDYYGCFEKWNYTNFVEQKPWCERNYL